MTLLETKRARPAPPRTAARRDSTRGARPRPCSALPILLVDDDEVFRSALAELLREEGHELLEYAAPGELPPIGSVGPVAVVISDYQLPGVDGLDFAAAYHDVHPAVPILLVTACSARGIELPESLRGYVHVWPKPIDFDALHAFVHEVSNARGVGASVSEPGTDGR